jgi:hypothetical protein
LIAFLVDDTDRERFLDQLLIVGSDRAGQHRVHDWANATYVAWFLPIYVAQYLTEFDSLADSFVPEGDLAVRVAFFGSFLNFDKFSIILKAIQILFAKSLSLEETLK